MGGSSLCGTHVSKIDNVKLICPLSCERTDILEAATTLLRSVTCICGGMSVWRGQGSIKLIGYFLYLRCDVDFIILLRKFKKGILFH